MKDAIIIGLCAIVLAGAGFGVGFATTKVDSTPMSDKLQAKAASLGDAVKPDTSASNLKMHNGKVYGGIGAVVGVIAGAGACVVMGKKN